MGGCYCWLLVEGKGGRPWGRGRGKGNGVEWGGPGQGGGELVELNVHESEGGCSGGDGRV